MQDLFAKGAASGSVLRHLDARTKLLVTAATAVLTVSCSSPAAETALFLVTLAYALLLRRPVLLAVLYVLMGVMMAVAAGFALLLEAWLPAFGGGVAFKSLAVPFLRGLSMMNVVMALALTTRVEDLLGTLERMRIPFCIFLPTAVTLRFIPTFTNDIRQVWETLRIRGWPMGPAMLTLRPLLSARLILAPILFRALKTSETLGVASELKGLGAGPRRSMRGDGRTMTSLDARVIAVVILGTVLVVGCEIFLKSLWAVSGSGMM